MSALKEPELRLLGNGLDGIIARVPLGRRALPKNPTPFERLIRYCDAYALHGHSPTQYELRATVGVQLLKQWALHGLPFQPPETTP